MFGTCVVTLIAVAGCCLSSQAIAVRRERRSPSPEAVASSSVIATPNAGKGKPASNPNFVGKQRRHVTTTQLGGTFQLRCEASGTPIPAVSWLLNGRPAAGTSGAIVLAPDSSTSVEYEARSSFPANGLERAANSKLKTIQWGSTASALTVPCVKESDLGVYSCVAENSVRRNTMNFTVRGVSPVDDADDVKCVEDGVAASTSIVTWTRDRIERHLAAVQLQCQGSGGASDKPVRWFRSFAEVDETVVRIPIASNDSFDISPTGDLMVKQADLCTGGCLFTCQIGERRYDSFLMATVERDESAES